MYKTVYVYGKVRYIDAFGKEQQTEYRLIYGGKDGGRKKLHKEGFVMGILQPDTEGNDAT
jgi:hypothetical protein